MKKYFTDGENTIDIYQFMEICGLQCKKKKNIRVSHKIMIRKLKLRYQSFAENIILPQRVAFGDYCREDVLKGKIVEVVDDSKKVIAYKNPLLLNEKDLLHILISNANKKELKKIRESILEEQKYRIKVSGEIVKKEEEEIDYEITEKFNRSQLFNTRGGRSLKKKR